MISDTVRPPAAKNPREYQIPGVRIIPLSQSLGPLTHLRPQLLLIVASRGACRLRGESQLTMVKAGYLAAGNLRSYSHLDVIENALSESAGFLFCLTPEFTADFIRRYKDVFDDSGVTRLAPCPVDLILSPVTSLIEAGINSIALHFNYPYENQHLLMKLKVDALLISLVSECVHYKNYLLMSSKATNGHLKNRLRFLLLEHAFSDAPICKIAEIGGYSPTAFKKLVKAELGYPPRQWINKVRLERSLELLNDNNNSIAFVSHEVGFESQSYFSVIFKREYGISPKEFQKKSK